MTTDILEIAEMLAALERFMQALNIVSRNAVLSFFWLCLFNTVTPAAFSRYTKTAVLRQIWEQRVAEKTTQIASL